MAVCGRGAGRCGHRAAPGRAGGHRRAAREEARGHLIDLSKWLSGLGRREETLTAIDEAVTAYRQLAAARPDVFLPDLAGSLNNQSGRLSDLGRREEAPTAIDEAVTIRRQLASARPQIYSARLAASLENLASQLEAAGRKPEADTARAEAARWSDRHY